MVNYICYRCKYTTKYKSNVKKHLDKVFSCKPKYNNIDISECKEYILKGISYEDYINKNNNITKNVCKYCNKSYKFNSALSYHLKTCKVKNEEITILKDELENKNKELDNKDKELEDMRYELNLIKDTYKKEVEDIGKIYCDTIKRKNKELNKYKEIIESNKLDMNIKLNSFRDTDLHFLTDKVIHECLMKSSMCYLKLLEKIHFNKDKPENMNIQISSIKSNSIRIYENDMWITYNKYDILMEICDNITEVCDRYIEYCEDNLINSAMCKRFRNYQKKLGNDDFINILLKEIENRIYDHSLKIKKQLKL